jgi:hypothetical protein
LSLYKIRKNALKIKTPKFMRQKDGGPSWAVTVRFRGRQKLYPGTSIYGMDSRPAIKSLRALKTDKFLSHTVNT